MGRTRIEAPPEDAEFLRLRQLGKDNHLKVAEKPLDLESWPGRISLLAISNVSEVFALGRQDDFVSGTLRFLRDAVESGSQFQPEQTIPLLSPPVNIKFTCDGRCLIVCTRDGKIRTYGGFRTSSTSTPPFLQHEFVHSNHPISDIQPNPLDKPEIVAVLRTAKDGSTVLEIIDTAAAQVILSMAGAAGPSAQTAICWSPKGKQIAVGNGAGDILLYGSDGSQKAIITQPEDREDPRQVVSILWAEKSTFLVVYGNSWGDHDYSTYVILRDTKGDSTMDILLEDPAPPYGMTSRKSARAYSHLRQWEPTKNLLFVTDAPSDDIGVVACMTGDKPHWTKLDLDDTARGQVPLADDSSSSSIVGFDLDLASTSPISTSTQFGDDSPPLPPAPIVFAYTSESIVIAYHVLNSNTPVYPGMNPIWEDTNQAPKPEPSTSSTLAAKPTLGFGAPPAGTAVNVGFGGVSVPSITTFGAPSKPVPALPTSFGGAAKFGSSGTPAFGQSGFGQSGFGQSSFGQKSGFPGGASGGASTSSAFKGFSAVANQSTLSQPTFGSGTSNFPSLSVGASQPPAPALGAFGTSSSTPSTFGAPSAPAFSLTKPSGTTTTNVPTFGASTAFGSAAGAPNVAVAKPSLPAPVTVTTGSGFGGFAPSTGGGGFTSFSSGNAGSSSALFGGQPDKSAGLDAPPSSAMSFSSSAFRSSPADGRGKKQDDEDEDDDEQKPSPEPELQGRDTPKTSSFGGNLFSGSRQYDNAPSPSAFSSMSIGTARPSAFAKISSLDVSRGSASPSLSSAIPMSTTSTTFGRDATVAQSTRFGFGAPPTQPNRREASASDEDGAGADQLTESGDDQGGDESADGQEEEEEAEGEDEDEQYEGRSPSLSPVAEERETDDDQSQTETVEPSNLFAGLSVGTGSGTNTSQTMQQVRERSITPLGSRPTAQAERNQGPSMFAPIPKQPSPRAGQQGQTVSPSADVPRLFRGGRNGLQPTPPISSPLSKPPIFASTASVPERTPTMTAKAQTGFQQPLPPDAPDKPSIARQKTPPLLFGVPSTKPKPGGNIGGFAGFAPPTAKATSVSKPAGTADPPKFGTSGSLFESTPPASQRPTAQMKPRGSFGEASQTPPPARPKADNPMEAEFLRVIALVNDDIAKVHKRLDQAQRHLADWRNVPQVVYEDEREPRPRLMAFNHMQSLGREARDWIPEIVPVITLTSDLKRQIAEMQSAALRAETRREEIRRYLQAKDDPTIAKLVETRSLGPEHADIRNRLRQLHQVVADRVESLELIVRDAKKKADHEKEGKRPMQAPTLDTIHRSLNHIQQGAKGRLSNLDILIERVGALSLNDDAEDLSDGAKTFSNATAQLGTPSISRSAGQTSGSRRGVRFPEDSEVRSSAAAALNSERSSMRLKAALLELLPEPTARWNRITHHTPDVAVLQQLSEPLRRPLNCAKEPPLPPWAKPAGWGDQSALVTPLPRKNSNQASHLLPDLPAKKDPPSFSFDQTDVGRRDNVGRGREMGSAVHTPTGLAKLKPLKLTTRGYRAPIDD